MFTIEKVMTNERKTTKGSKFSPIIKPKTETNTIYKQIRKNWQYSNKTNKK